MIKCTEWHGSVRWDGVDKQGKPTGGHYETVELLLVHTNGIYTRFTCRLEDGQMWRDWVGEGKHFKAQMSDAILRKIKSEAGCEISSTNLTILKEHRNDKPNEAAQVTAPKVAQPGR